MEMSKYIVHKACLEQLAANIVELKAAIADLKKSVSDYGPPRDRYDGYRSQMMRKGEILARQLENAQDQIALLERIDPELNMDAVAFGALVKTQNQTVFVVTGMGKIETPAGTVYVISPQVPFYDAIAGKKQGEAFVFRGQKNKIVSLF